MGKTCKRTNRDAELAERVQESIKARIAHLRGETVLSDFQLEKIAEMVLSKLREAVSLYQRNKRDENR